MQESNQLKVPLYRHNLHGCDLDSVAAEFRRAVGSMAISTGPVCNDVQKRFAEYMRTDHCLLTNNWTNAAIVALMSLNIGHNDEVIIPALTFAGTANAIMAVGARPVLVDIDPRTKLMDLNQIRRALNFRTKAIVPVHLYGQMVDIRALRDVLGDRLGNVAILEDAAHAIESELDGHKPGAHSTAALFSFYASKNITTGEGGAMVTNDEDFFSKFSLKYRHGIDRHNSEPFMISSGIKANMPDVQALMIPPQLDRINETHAARVRHARIYFDELSNLDIEFPELVPNSVHAWHQFTIGVDEERRESIMAGLNSRGISTTIHYRALNDMPFMRERFRFGTSDFPNATAWGRKTISLPIFPDLREDEQAYVIKVLRDIL